jgi:hypothetical protein
LWIDIWDHVSGHALDKLRLGLRCDSRLYARSLDRGGAEPINRRSVVGTSVDVAGKRTQFASYPLHRLLNLLAGLHQAIAHSDRLGDFGRRVKRSVVLLGGGLKPERAHAFDHVADIGWAVALDLQLRIFLSQERQLCLELARRGRITGGGLRSVGDTHAQEPSDCRASPLYLSGLRRRSR